MTNTVSATNAYLEYLDFAKNQQSAKIKHYSYYLEKFPFFLKALNSLPCAVFIINYKTQAYLFMSKGCFELSGYTSKEFVEKGLKFLMSEVMLPEWFEYYNNEGFTKMLNNSKSLSDEEIINTKFSINYMIRRKNGTYAMMLQQSVYIERDEEHNPLLSLGICTDISEFSVNRPVLTISRFDRQSNKFYLISSDESKMKQIEEEKTEKLQILNISEREKEIIGYICNGFNSKQIAKSLNISNYTVLAHRRSILLKTDCHNTASLIKYSLVNRIV